MNYSIASWFLCGFVLLDAALVAFSAQTSSEPSKLQYALEQRRESYLKQHAAWFEGKSQHSLWLKSFLEDTKRGVTRPSQDWSLALLRLTSLAKSEHVIHQNSGFIEDSPTMDLLVAALGGEDAEVKKVAVQLLAWETHQKDLVRLSGPIKEQIGASQSEDAMFLMGKLPLTQAETDGLLARVGDNLAIRARLGDREAERALIEAFRNEGDYHRKSALARYLGYVATTNCASALVDGLASDLSFSGVYDDRSIRCNILLALGQIYQNEDLFTRDAHLIAENSDAVLEVQYGKQKYVQAVDTWVKQNFGHQAWNTKDVWFIRFRNVPIVRPEKEK